MPDHPSPLQLRGARALLNWSMVDLARAAGVSVSTVKRAEEAAAEHVAPATVSLIREALEAHGIGFWRDEAAEAVTIRTTTPGDERGRPTFRRAAQV